MVGPGTGVAPFRAFLQERAAQLQVGLPVGKSILFYGCRKAAEDYLYKDEWPEYGAVLGDKFSFQVAFSRDAKRKPDGSKIYVQDLIWDDRERIADEILQKKGYIYICGDAKSMSKAVEETLARILGEAKGGSAEVEGVLEVKLLKERSRMLLDVWS